MARIRTIKPDFWTDEKVVEISAFARLLFIGLWNFADDEGRMVYSPNKIKMQIFPADSLNISELIGEIRGKSMIEVYDVDGIQYLQINNFTEHQKVDKRTPSKIPAPPNSPKSPRRNGMEGKGNINKTALPEDFKVSDRVQKWAHEKGHSDLPAHLENFISSCRKHGYKYVDWDEALMEAIRKNWAKIEKPKANRLAL